MLRIYLHNFLVCHLVFLRSRQREGELEIVILYGERSCHAKLHIEMELEVNKVSIYSKPVYNSHPRDWSKLAAIDRWPLYRG